MDVHYRKPTYHPHASDVLVFPNEKDIPEDRWISHLTIRAYTSEDVMRFKILQADLFALLEKSADYLRHLPNEGDAILFYQHQLIEKKGEARKFLHLPPINIYLFGLIIATSEGESHFKIGFKDAHTLEIWFASHGLVDQVFQDVIRPFQWHTDIGMHVSGWSKFDVMVRAAFEEYDKSYPLRHMNGYPFDVPHELYQKVINRIS